MNRIILLTVLALFSALNIQAQEQKSDTQETTNNGEETPATDSDDAIESPTNIIRVESQKYEELELTPIDTLTTGTDAVKVVLYNNKTWRYIRNRAFEKDATIFEKYWDNSNLLPYKEVTMAEIPDVIGIELVDSITRYHYPCLGKVHPNGRYGPRRRRQHHGVDIPYKTGTPVYAAFTGRVRVSDYKNGYGNLIVLRHDNGLETYYGHLSERMVEPNQWVEAGQVIGLGGSTGRSTGPHLHFETRYYGQSFDPQRLIDFESGLLVSETFLLKKSFFSIHSRAGQDFEDEVANDEEDKKEVAVKVATTYHKIRSGDTLGKIARKYGTTVSKICKLNNIKSTTILRLGKSLRVR